MAKKHAYTIRVTQQNAASQYAHLELDATADKYDLTKQNVVSDDMVLHFRWQAHREDDGTWSGWYSLHTTIHHSPYIGYDLISRQYRRIAKAANNLNSYVEPARILYILRNAVQLVYDPRFSMYRPIDEVRTDMDAPYTYYFGQEIINVVAKDRESAQKMIASELIDKNCMSELNHWIEKGMPLEHRERDDSAGMPDTRLAIEIIRSLSDKVSLEFDEMDGTTVSLESPNSTESKIAEDEE